MYLSLGALLVVYSKVMDDVPQTYFYIITFWDKIKEMNQVVDSSKNIGLHFFSYGIFVPQVQPQPT